MFVVFFTPTAQRQADAIANWWAEHRPDSPALFADELEAARHRLSAAPRIGQLYTAHGPTPANVRRVLLLRSHFHVYYTVDEQRPRVIVRAVWHGARGHGPQVEMLS